MAVSFYPGTMARVSFALGSLMSMFTAFAGQTKVASGDLVAVALQVKIRWDAGSTELLAIFNDATGHAVELDLRGSPSDVAVRLSVQETVAEARGPGRPKLGVVAREVTLLPRHWDWLSRQSGGASAVLRRLVDQARRAAGTAERAAEARDALHRFMTAMAGNEAGYEDALRALYSSDAEAFGGVTAGWPTDVRDHAWLLATRAFSHLPVSSTAISG